MASRPEHASASYIKDLLERHVFVPDLPDDVADAILAILIDRGFFEIDGEHYELAGQPGLTQQLPEKAGEGMRRALGEFTLGTKGTEVLQRLIRGSGASGTGAGGAPVNQAALQAARAKAAERDLAEFEWHRTELVDALSPSDPAPGSIVLDHIIDDARRMASATMFPSPSRGAPSRKVVQPVRSVGDEDVPDGRFTRARKVSECAHMLRMSTARLYRLRKKSMKLRYLTTDAGLRLHAGDLYKLGYSEDEVASWI